MLTTRIYRAGPPARGGARRAPRRRRHPVLPALRRRARARSAARVAHGGRAAGAAEAARDLARATAVPALSQGQTLGHVRSGVLANPELLYHSCMGRPAATARSQGSIRRRSRRSRPGSASGTPTSRSSAQLTASAERLGRSPTMQEFAADPQTTVHPQTVIEHFGTWNAAKRRPGSCRGASRPARSCSGCCGSSARSSDARRRRATSTRARARCRRSRCYWHTFGSLSNALREAGFDVPVGEERLERAVEQGASSRGSSAGCRSSPTGPAARRADERC